MKVYHQSVFDRWPFEDNSVQAIITSPPYWGLRKYDIPDVEIDGWKGQYGLEPSHKDYIAHTILWAKEAWRVLRGDGVFFLNIGDSYGGSGRDRKDYHANNSGFQGKMGYLRGGLGNNTRAKCKMLIPHRTAIALIDSMVDGWVLRNDIIWKKIPYMPESVKDRFTKCYENIFFFVKSQKYFFDHDPIREPLKMNRWSKSNKLGSSNKDTKTGGGAPGQSPHSWERKGHSGYFDGDGNPLFNPKGRQACDVWEINIQPSPEKHFAMWPEKLVERMIRCSTKPGDTVLDPFAGSGTTLRVAERLNRIGYGIDLGYQDIQARRLNEIQKELL